MIRTRTGRLREAVLGVVALAVVVGCVSRYRMDLYMGEGEARRKVKVETTAFAPDTQLNDPLAEPKTAPGNGSTVTISVGTRGPDSGGRDLLLGFDEFLKLRIYVELPRTPAKGTIDLVGHSFVQLLMHYELPLNQKMYLPVSGSFVIDSVKESDMYATLRHGVWKNDIDSTVTFEGRMKVKIK